MLDSYEHAFIKAQVAALRQHSTLPIIWTVRTVKEGGNFDKGEKEWIALLLLGLRLGCEYLDVEVKSGGVEGRQARRPGEASHPHHRVVSYPH